MNIIKFIEDPDLKMLFIDGPTGVGKTLFSYEFAKEHKDINGKDYMLLTTIVPMASINQFLNSLIFPGGYKNTLNNLVQRFEYQLIQNKTKILIIDESQNLLLNKRICEAHFNFMYSLVNRVDIKVIYLGKEPFEKFNLPVSIKIRSLSVKYDLVS